MARARTTPAPPCAFATQVNPNPNPNPNPDPDSNPNPNSNPNHARTCHVPRAGYETPSDCEAGDCVCSRQSCAAQCASCSAAATAICTSCAEPLPLLHGGTCLDACPSGLFEDKSGACQACDTTCTACNGPNATDCTACDPIGTTAYLYGRDPLTFLKGGACLVGCGVGFYADDARECQQCAYISISLSL